MKNMDEFRRSVYEKAEKKAAEEKAKKLRITKFGTIAASLAVVIIPIMLVAGSMPKNNETAESSPSYTETRTDGVKTTLTHLKTTSELINFPKYLKYCNFKNYEIQN